MNYAKRRENKRGNEMKDRGSKKSETKRTKRKITMPVKVWRSSSKPFKAYTDNTYEIWSKMKSWCCKIMQKMSKFYFTFGWSNKLDAKRSQKCEFFSPWSETGKYEAKQKLIKLKKAKQWQFYFTFAWCKKFVANKSV